MVFRSLFLLGIWLSGSFLIGMDIVEIDANPVLPHRIKTLDAAEVIVSAYPREQWNNYPLSSRVIAQAIKNKELASTTIPHEEEIAIIKALKKSDPDQHAQLVGQVYESLSCPEKHNVLQELRARVFAGQLWVVEKKRVKLERLQKQLVHFDAWNGKFGNHARLAWIIGVLLVLELVPLACTGAFVGECWS